MRISVAMCTYNGAAYVQEQLESITRQTRPADELIVCDDASTDETTALVRAFARAHADALRVEVVVNPTNVGYVKNFESAIARCTGDLIALADQDDVWHPHKLARCETTLVTRPGASLVFSDARLVDAHLNSLSRSLWESVGFDAALQQRFREGAAFQTLMRKQVMTGATTMLRASVRDLILPIPDGAPHDGWIALLCAAVSELAFIDEPLIDYRQHASNQIGAMRRGVLARIADARRRRSRNAFGVLPDWCAEAERRLARWTAPLVEPAAVELLRALRRHLSARSTLPEKRVARAVPVLRELTSGRYGRFSNGWLSAAMDVLL